MSEKEPSASRPVSLSGTAIGSAVSSQLTPKPEGTTQLATVSYSSAPAVGYIPVNSNDYSPGKSLSQILNSSSQESSTEVNAHTSKTNSSLSQSNSFIAAKNISLNTTTTLDVQANPFGSMVLKVQGTSVAPQQNLNLTRLDEAVSLSSTQPISLPKTQTLPLASVNKSSTSLISTVASSTCLPGPFGFPAMASIPSVSVTSMSAALSSLTQPLTLPPMLSTAPTSSSSVLGVPLTTHTSLSSLFNSTTTAETTPATLAPLSQSLPLTNLMNAAASAPRLEPTNRPQNIGSSEQVQSFLGPGEIATLNTQQGQSFSVVILGDSQSRIPSLFPFGNFGMAQPLGSNMHGAFPGNFPQGTYFLAVTPSAPLAENPVTTLGSVPVDNSSEKGNSQVVTAAPQATSDSSAAIPNTKSVITKAPPKTRQRKSKVATNVDSTNVSLSTVGLSLGSFTSTQKQQINQGLTVTMPENANITEKDKNASLMHQLAPVLPRGDQTAEKQKNHKMIKLGWEGRVAPSNAAEAVLDAPKRTQKETEEGKTREKRHKCTQCDKAYYTSSHLKAHMRTHTGERPFSCDVCGKSYHRPEALSAHVRLHLGIKRFECEICGKKYGYYSHLNVHVKRVHKKLRPYSCEVCGKAFTMMNNLRYHMKIHSDVKPHKCHLCGRGFVYPNDLQRHIRGHTGERKFKCDICGKGFIESGSVVRHKKTVHERHNEPGEVVLTVGFNQANTTESQQKKPARPDTLYTCGKCGKTFAKERQLSFHQRIHHDDGKKFSCAHCERTFSSLRCARAHENRMHLLERGKKSTYQCSFCGENFSSKRKLVAHRTNHYKLDDNSKVSDISESLTQKGTYQCSVCHREFDFPGGLIIHRLSHSNFKPYTCSKCGASYRVKRSLTSHESKCDGRHRKKADNEVTPNEQTSQEVLRTIEVDKVVFIGAENRSTISLDELPLNVRISEAQGAQRDGLESETSAADGASAVTVDELSIQGNVAKTQNRPTSLPGPGNEAENTHNAGVADQLSSAVALNLSTIAADVLPLAVNILPNNGNLAFGSDKVTQKTSIQHEKTLHSVQNETAYKDTQQIQGLPESQGSSLVENNSDVMEVVVQSKGTEHDCTQPLKKSFYVSLSNLLATQEPLEMIDSLQGQASTTMLDQDGNAAEVLYGTRPDSESEGLPSNVESVNKTPATGGHHSSVGKKFDDSPPAASLGETVSENEDRHLVTPRPEL